MHKTIILNNLKATSDFAKEIAELIFKVDKPMYLLLSGDLGAGKTTFTKQLLLNLGVKQNVTSPTFVIMNQYQVNDLVINHMDAYRLDKTSDVEMYFDEFDEAINIIEWPGNLNVDWTNFKTIKLCFKIIDEETRQVEVG
ncbi:tRNA (adenosine(37)-N6)-threonylcarbamoyltransferase complex ATPase subunit type 1 TsaE [Williamsoniiplasma luminosum]|uniref:tRNA (adenosine(37)-N6)-threonylcarbamoyltransferase complex ATPase subunit type 1 TsaE n=1 Tax=Williamsoniiplasma luminosum TaxID=214888 RepID=UPI002682DB7B|nr:tRNA (adenosine(37)-N6)-threonylcarbamoyltransferase complex ATPase subunit type 1 TsaE [Williamsoniiplasma luminosum]